MSDEKKNNVIWRIKSIDLLSFNAEKLPDDFPQIDPNKISFELAMGLNIEASKKQVTILFPVKIFSDDTNTTLLGSIQTKGEFVIKNFEEVLSRYKNSFPSHLAAVLVGVTLSTTRGMLILLSKGSVFEKAIIPIMDPRQFFLNPEKQEKVKKSV